MRFAATISFLFFLAISNAFARTGPDTVKLGIYIVSIHDINFHEQEYTARFWLWFITDNPKLDFSKQIDIPNAKDIEISSVSVDTVKGKYWTQMRLKCTMKENWLVHDFPFDEQHLRIMIEDEALTSDDIVFKADTVDSQFEGTEALTGWVVDKFQVTTRETTYNSAFGNPAPEKGSQKFSLFSVDIFIKREAGGLFLKVFLGMYFAFLIALVSFLTDTNEMEPRFGLPVGGLFAAVGNKYIIDSLLPESSHFSLVDILHSLTFMGIFGVLTVSAIALRLHNNGKVDTAHMINRIGATIVIGGYILSNIYYIITA